jgi:hypothetical protein
METPPKEMFRDSLSGCVYDEQGEAVCQSVDHAVNGLHDLLTIDRPWKVLSDSGKEYNRDFRFVRGDLDLLEKQVEIDKAMKVLSNAMKGKYVVKYKLSK